MADSRADSSDEDTVPLPDLAKVRLSDILKSEDSSLARALRRLCADPGDYYAAFGNAPSPAVEQTFGVGKR